MTILIADLDDVLELTQVDRDSRAASEAGADGAIQRHFATLQRWTTYMTGETSPQHALPERIVFKACADDRIVGFIAGHLTTRFGQDAEIQTLHVPDEHERDLVGRSLLLRFMTWSLEHEAHRVCVEIPEDSEYGAVCLEYGARRLTPHWLSWDDAAMVAARIRHELSGSVR